MSVYGLEDVVDRVHEFMCPNHARSGAGTPPILIIEGPHGSGKTALLTHLRETEFDQRFPYGIVDFEVPSHTDTRGALATLRRGLHQHLPRYGRIEFPRLDLGLWATGEERFSNDPFLAQRVLQQELSQLYRSGDLAGVAINIFGVTVPVNTIVGIGSMVFSTKGPRWYGQHSALSGDWADSLIELNHLEHDTREGPTADRRTIEARAAVDRVLCEAFLADLRDYRRETGKLLNPIIMLDNADEPAGRRFLSRLLDARSLETQPQRLTIVATSRGELAKTLVGDGTTLEEYRREPGTPPAWVRHSLTSLEPYHVESILKSVAGPAQGSTARLSQPSRRRWGWLIHEFTGGHPGTTRMLVELLASHVARASATDRSIPPDTPQSVGELLELTDDRNDAAAGHEAQPASSTTDRMLWCLLPTAMETQPGRVDALTTCAAARTWEDAQRLTRDSGLVDAHWASQISSAGLWEDSGSAHTTVLRRVLLRRLAERPPASLGEQPDWNTVHRRLQAYCEERQDTTGALYHRLARGELYEVSRELDRLLPEMDGQDWLAMLTSVTEAPSGDLTRHRRLPVDQFNQLVRQQHTEEADDRLRHATEVTAALWTLSDPCNGTAREGLHEDAAQIFGELAPHSRNDSALRDEAKKHRQSEEWWRLPPSQLEPGPVTRRFLDPRPHAGYRVAKVAAATVALVMMAGLLVWLVPRVPCGMESDVTAIDGECIGVTDGSYRFLPHESTGSNIREKFEEIQEQIKAENDSVVEGSKQKKGTPAVKVALISTLTPTASSPLSPEQILRSLQGAYVAQWRANNSKAFGNTVPRIQLVLANAGSRQRQWEPVVKDLVAMTDDTVPLVAVAGWGVSTKSTRDAMRELSRHDIPIVSSVASADGLNTSKKQGISNTIRVTPSDTDFVEALHDYTKKKHPDIKTGILVYDNNSPDLHVATMTAAFKKQFKTYLDDTFPQPFKGGTLNKDPGNRLLSEIAESVCHSEAELVLFSGRGPDLEVFIQHLHADMCGRRQIVVLFVETGLALKGHEETVRLLKRRNAVVAHASAIDPEWIDAELEGVKRKGCPESYLPPKGFAGFSSEFRKETGEGRLALRDGYAVAHHDAVMTVVKAIRMNVSPAQVKVDHEQVSRALFLLNSHNTVEAAGGTLVFDEARHGDPGCKPIPIIEVPGSGSPRASDVYLTPPR